jgi:hypothetical protein
MNQSRDRQRAVELFRNLTIAALAGMIPLLNVSKALARFFNCCCLTSISRNTYKWFFKYCEYRQDN